MPPVQTGTLQTILVGEASQDPAEDPENGRLVVGEEHGPWVVTVTDTLRDALASADEAQLLWVAGQWAATEELAADGWTAEDALGVLVELAGLARHATSESLRLYCWICL